MASFLTLLLLLPLLYTTDGECVCNGKKLINPFRKTESGECEPSRNISRKKRSKAWVWCGATQPFCYVDPDSTCEDKHKQFGGNFTSCIACNYKTKDQSTGADAGDEHKMEAQMNFPGDGEETGSLFGLFAPKSCQYKITWENETCKEVCGEETVKAVRHKVITQQARNGGISCGDLTDKVFSKTCHNTPCPTTTTTATETTTEESVFGIRIDTGELLDTENYTDKEWLVMAVVCLVAVVCVTGCCCLCGCCIQKRMISSRNERSLRNVSSSTSERSKEKNLPKTRETRAESAWENQSQSQRPVRQPGRPGGLAPAAVPVERDSFLYEDTDMYDTMSYGNISYS